MAQGDVSAEEFAAWLSPKAALAAVPSDIDQTERKAWIIRRLQLGHIVARAETMIVTDIKGRRETHLAAIGSHVWRWREIGDWFSSGDLEVTTAPDSVPAGSPALTAYRWDNEKKEVARYATATFFEVRLDPAGFPQRTSPPPVASSNNTADPRTHLQEAVARTFCERHLRAHPDSTRQEAWDAARAAFPENKVPRNPFFEIFSDVRGPRRPGPRSKRGN